MLVGQAIFTSVRGNLNAGYQLAGRSSGISDQQAQTLAKWGPSHDSLYSHRATGCVNFHPIDDGLFNISKTILAGREYSGRGGQRVYTHMIVVDRDALLRFANNPFRIVEALSAAGRLLVIEPIPSRLEPLQLLGRASAVNETNIRSVCDRVGPTRLASLICLVQRISSVGIISDVDPNRLIACLLDLLPPAYRPHVSFTTGLRASRQRPFDWMILPDDPTEQRRTARRTGQTAVDLRYDLPDEFSPNTGWPRLIRQLLSDRQYQTYGEALRQLDWKDSQADPDQLAERLLPTLC